MDGNSGSGGSSSCPIISADGRYVIFISGATNLVAGETNGAMDVYRRDLQTGTTALVSTESPSSGGLVPSGFYMRFACLQPGRPLHRIRSARNAIPRGIGLFWRDMNSGMANWFCRNINFSRPISMSADGQRVAYFDSLVPGFMSGMRICRPTSTPTRPPA